MTNDKQQDSMQDSEAPDYLPGLQNCMLSNPLASPNYACTPTHNQRNSPRRTRIDANTDTRHNLLTGTIAQAPHGVRGWYDLCEACVLCRCQGPRAAVKLEHVAMPRWQIS